MQKFSEFNEEHKDGTFVAAWVDKATSKKLESFLDSLNIKGQVKPDNYHSTIIYSAASIPDAKKEKFKTPFTGKFKEWKVFPNRIEGGNYLVAIVTSPDLEKYHNRMKELGGTSAFPDYHAHVSCSSKFEGKVPREKPAFDFTYDRVTVQPLDPNFKPERKN